MNKFYRSNKKYWLSTELIDWTSATRASDFQICQSDIHEQSQSLTCLPCLLPTPFLFPCICHVDHGWRLYLLLSNQKYQHFGTRQLAQTLLEYPSHQHVFFWKHTHPSDLSREKNQSAYTNIYNINLHTYHWLSQRIPKQLEKIQNKYKTEQIKEKKSYRGIHVFKYLGWWLISAEFLICLWAFLNLKHNIIIFYLIIKFYLYH